MDPVSTAAAVVTIVTGVAAAVDWAYKLHRKHKQKNAEKASAADQPSLPGGSVELSLLLNTLMSRLGRDFGRSLDGKRPT
jgi:hypothetical protein